MATTTSSPAGPWWEHARARLALFAVALLVVFGAGVGLGSVVAGDDAPPAAPSDGHDHEPGGDR